MLCQDSCKSIQSTFFITVHNEETDTANLRGRSGATNNDSLNPCKTLYNCDYCLYIYMYIDLLMKKEPHEHNLLIIFKDYEHEYSRVGTGLSVNVADLKNDQNPILTVFQRWKAANKEVTWQKIADICDSHPDHLGKVKSNLLTYLSSQEAHDKYLDTQDWA